MPRQPGGNLLFRLHDRECNAAKPSAEVNRIRRWYEILTPSEVIKRVELPDLHVCRFTPSGQYLVCFGPLQQELLLYRYTGLHYPTPGEAASGSSSPDSNPARVPSGPDASASAATASRAGSSGAPAGHQGRSHGGGPGNPGTETTAAAAAASGTQPPSQQAASAGRQRGALAAVPAAQARSENQATGHEREGHSVPAGVAAAGSGNTPGQVGGSTEAALPPDVAQFHSHFQLQWRRRLVSHPQMLCKDAMLTMWRERLLVVAAQTPPQSAPASPGGPSGVPLTAATTVFLVETQSGNVTDQLVLEGDFVALSHNSGLSACRDRLAVLGLRSQTIKLLQVLPDGRFVALADLGRHLAPDDALVVGEAAVAEQRWRAVHPKGGQLIDGRLKALREAASGGSGGGTHTDGRSSPALSLQRASSGGLPAVLGGRRLPSVGGPAPASSLSGSALLGQLLHAPNALQSRTEAAEEAEEAAASRRPLLITGLRQRLLAYICLALRDPCAAAALLEAGGGGGGGDAGGMDPPLGATVGGGSIAGAAAAAAAEPSGVADHSGGVEQSGSAEQSGVAERPGGLRAGVQPPQGQREEESLRKRQKLADGGGGGAGGQQRGWFLTHFDTLASLVVWKAEFLGRGHLLLAVGPPEGASSLRSLDLQQQATFLALYSLPASRIVAVLPYSSGAVLEAWLRHAAWFHPGAASAPWQRFLTPRGHPAAGRLAVQRQLAQQFFTPAQVTRRALAAVPPSSGLLCSSPYLDAHLFHYDDKAVSPTTRPRLITEQALKFSWRGRRESVRLKLAPCFDPPPQGPRAPKQHVTWHFHPVVPFVLGVLQTPGHHTQAVIYHRP